MKNITIKKANKDIVGELNSIEFDKSYIEVAKAKYIGETYKIFNLKPYEANILKQICLSLGFDCAVSRNTITCGCEFTNAILFGSNSQITKLTQKLKKQPFRLKNLAQEFENVQNNKIKPLLINGYTFDTSKSYIMGILNVTPDSFSDGGKYNNVNSALEHTKKLISDGADIIDIGGESTRPGAIPVSSDEEISRVIPVIKKIRENNINIPISVDTRNFETAKSAIEAGANIINDVSGLDYDNKLFDYVTSKNIPVVIMHSNKVPAVCENFTEGNAIEEIFFSLKNKIELLKSKNMTGENIIIDLGFGFGKSAETNFELLNATEEFKTLNHLILAGISRKSFLKNSFDDVETATGFYSAVLATKNVNIHRVHNVKLTKQFLNYAEKLN